MGRTRETVQLPVDNVAVSLTVIGITGKIGAGKDAVAAHLVARYGFQIIRFSDALKQEVLLTLPRTLRAIWVERFGHAPSAEDLQDMVYRFKPPIVRELLQEWGTELRRAQDPNYWIKRWEEAVMAVEVAAGPAGARIVTPDVRFFNEFSAVLGVPGAGEVVRVIRPGTVPGEHQSETEQDRFPGCPALDNYGTIEDLQGAVDTMIVRMGLNLLLPKER